MPPCPRIAAPRLVPPRGVAKLFQRNLQLIPLSRNQRMTLGSFPGHGSIPRPHPPAPCNSEARQSGSTARVRQIGWHIFSVEGAAHPHPFETPSLPTPEEVYWSLVTCFPPAAQTSGRFLVSKPLPSTTTTLLCTSAMTDTALRPHYSDNAVSGIGASMSSYG